MNATLHFHQNYASLVLGIRDAIQALCYGQPGRVSAWVMFLP